MLINKKKTRATQSVAYLLAVKPLKLQSSTVTLTSNL